MAKPKSDKGLRAYTVVSVSPDGETLKMIDPEVKALRQEAATDRVWESLPDDQKVGKFVLAAFLTRNYREFEYEAERQLVKKRKPRAPSFAKARSTEPPDPGPQAT